MTSDKQGEGAREGGCSDGSQEHSYAAIRSLEEHGVDLTGSESGAELSSMQSAVEAFRRAADALAGSMPLIGPSKNLSRQVVPPRAADETPRQYTERVTRMTERFRSLTWGPGRDRPR